MNAAIVGASGYSGEELVRLLARHPDVELRAVTSRSLAGRRVADAMPAFVPGVGDLEFEDSDPSVLAARDDVDVFFLALPHGAASTFAQPLHEAGRTVIDLSADFRLGSADLYREAYGTEHPAPELLEAPYVIPELAPDGWAAARLIACPGCYPTSVLVPLLPLVRAGAIDSGRIVINSYSGISGAGKKATEDYIYCERNESLKGYGMPRHRHAAEIEEQLTGAAGTPVVVQFNPHLAPLTRGIATTIVVPAATDSVDAAYDAWGEAYAGKPFVNLLPGGRFPDTRDVAHTNRVDLSAVHDPRTGNLVITSAIDNLLKGAGGQAVQILNLKAGFDETAGLL